MSFIDKSALPKHIAIIMDGNGRWAQAKRLDRVEGHRQGVLRSEEIITAASELGLSFLTLYAFSKENWLRPKGEVEALMGLLEQFLLAKKEKMLKNGIRLNAIGDLSLLPGQVRKTLQSVIDETSVGQGMVLTLALSYGARDEVIRAVNKIVAEEKKGITEGMFGNYLDTATLPDPDLIIRTGGECRISNFLLWQSAYAEMIFEDCFWPDFTPEKFLAAIAEFQSRERRFGKTREQLK